MRFTSGFFSSRIRAACRLQQSQRLAFLTAPPWRCLSLLMFHYACFIGDNLISPQVIRNRLERGQRGKRSQKKTKGAKRNESQRSGPWLTRPENPTATTITLASTTTITTIILRHRKVWYRVVGISRGCLRRCLLLLLIMQRLLHFGDLPSMLLTVESLLFPTEPIITSFVRRNDSCSIYK